MHEFGLGVLFRIGATCIGSGIARWTRLLHPVLRASSHTLPPPSLISRHLPTFLVPPHPPCVQLMVKLTQTMMADRLMFVDDTQCTVLEVRRCKEW